MKTLVALFIFFIASCQAEQHDDHNQQHNKKEHLGFFGSRGRRSIDPDTATTISAENGNEASLKELSNLRDTIFGMGMQRNVRAPKGFFGMRGKKDYDLQNQEKRALLGIQQNLNGLRERTRFVEPQLEEDDPYSNIKRAPSQGFFGMRGKKFGDYDLGGSLNDKRAPSGFMGMRGKKSGNGAFDDEEIDDPQVYDYNYNSINDKRAPSGFYGVRGKKLKLPANLIFRR